MNIDCIFLWSDFEEWLFGYSEINPGYPFYFYCGCFYSMAYPLIRTYVPKEECHRSKGYIEVT